jgi:hypothetical protein
MTNANRRVFAYAPLRSQTNAIMKAPLHVVPSDWYEGISEKSLKIFDSVAALTFSVIGIVMMISPFRWVSQYNRLGLASESVAGWGLVQRISVVILATCLSYAALWAAQKLNLMEFFDSMTLWVPVKLLATALFSWGAFYLFHDPVTGLIPMAGFTVIALLILFHTELKDSVILSLVLGACGLPILLLVW